MCTNAAEEQYFAAARVHQTTAASACNGVDDRGVSHSETSGVCSQKGEEGDTVPERAVMPRSGAMEPSPCIYVKRRASYRESEDTASLSRYTDVQALCHSEVHGASSTMAQEGTAGSSARP